MRQAMTTTAMALMLAGSGTAIARAQGQPADILPQSAATPAASSSQPAASPTSPAVPSAASQPAAPTIAAQPVVTPEPVREPVMAWSLGDAQALLSFIGQIEGEGLIPTDYRPDELRAAIAGGPGPALDEAASKSFAWLAEDLRDGRTPVEARVQWFAVDPDQDTTPTEMLMRTALESHDIAGVLNGLAPTYPDYQALKAALATTPASDRATRALIRANMDRWRWLKRDLGVLYLLTNVPEFQLRLATNKRIVRTYRTVVGKPGRTATPQLAETVQNVVFNPTWTVPQSIVVGEGLGARLLGNPASAARQGYKVSRAANGMVTVVQQPGDSNALGRMKIDMPNPHAIYLHDTPSKSFFSHPVRAYSHGCIRTERAIELGMTMAIMGAGKTPEEVTQYWQSGKYTKVAMTQTFPVYITYQTMGRDITGEMRKFADIYGRDKPVLASFERVRQPKTTQRVSDEPIVQLDNPL